MSGVRVRKRRPAVRRRVDDSWVEELHAVDKKLRSDGSVAYVHRSQCAAPEGPCDCSVLLIGPAVRLYPS